MYLYVYFHTAGFEILREYSAPDFHLKVLGEELFVEAVTVNPTKQGYLAVDEQSDKSKKEYIDNYLPIKYGSPLFSKLNKKYFDLPHVKGKPLIFAIHDFHEPGSMVWSRTALPEYLYGCKHFLKVNEYGQKYPVSQKIYYHSWKGKRIPSNYFSLPISEYISGVLFSNAATITKFNRMGKLAGLGSKDIKLLRKGFLFDPNPESYDPIPFTVDVDSPEYEESWSDSLVLYHNPNAIYPLDPEWFNDISQIWLGDEKNVIGIYKPYDVLSSVTYSIYQRDDNNEEITDNF